MEPWVSAEISSQCIIYFLFPPSARRGRELVALKSNGVAKYTRPRARGVAEFARSPFFDRLPCSLMEKGSQELEDSLALERKTVRPSQT